MEQVGDALPEGVCPVGDVQAEGFLYLGLVQDGVGGALDGRGVLAAEAGTDVAMALLGREGVGGVLYHLGEVVPGADAEVGVVVDAGFGVGGRRPLPIPPLYGRENMVIGAVFRFDFVEPASTRQFKQV